MIKQCKVKSVLNESKKTGNQVLQLIDDQENEYIAEGNPDFFEIDDDVIYFSKDHALPIRSFNACRFDPATSEYRQNDTMVMTQARCVRVAFLYPVKPKNGFQDLESI